MAHRLWGHERNGVEFHCETVGVRANKERSNLESTNPSGIGEEGDQILFLS